RILTKNSGRQGACATRGAADDKKNAPVETGANQPGRKTTVPLWAGSSASARGQRPSAIDPRRAVHGEKKGAGWRPFGRVPRGGTRAAENRLHFCSRIHFTRVSAS